MGAYARFLVFHGDFPLCHKVFSHERRTFMPKVAIVMGSDSDLPVLKGGISRLKEFGVEVVVRAISAHRTPDVAAHIAQSAEQEGIEVIIAAAGMAAHLAGAMAANTPLPVIGIPVKSGALSGLDALYATVMMPPGVPVATVGIDAGDNAALLAIQILSVKYPELREKMRQYKKQMAEKVAQKDARLAEQIQSL